MPDREKAINDLNTAKLILCNPQMLAPEMRIKIGQAITSAIDLLREQEAQETMPSKEGALDKEQRQAALARLAIVFESSWIQAAQDNMKETADIYYDLWMAVRDAGKILQDRPEIIRCKECWKRNLDNCPFYDITDTIAPDEWFCPGGEKRETLGEEKTNDV